jgi:hypothetical protein
MGRFLPAIHDLARSLCAERTWTMPAHDRRLDNFHGRSVSVDLASSNLAWEFATALFLLSDKIDPAVEQTIRQRIEAWVFAPARAGITGEAREQFWMRATHNWNAVCNAAVVGAALALIESREDRATFVAAAETSARHFLSGFTPDGYCSEGLGYWNYGFGRFLLLAETVGQATESEMCLLELPGAREAARFPHKIHIHNGVYPAFADCAVHATPHAPTMFYLNRYFDFGWHEPEDFNASAVSGRHLPESLVFGFPNTVSDKPPRETIKGDAALRSWFQDAGILVARPARDSTSRFAVALKGGHNAEHHNHNDVGSFVAVVGKETLIVDPGAEVYTARTFSKDRYVSRVLNSFGHPVPLVGGQLQRKGRQAAAHVISSDFSDAADRLVLDITAAYDVPELERLTRTFEYSRSGSGFLIVRDDVAFKTASEFETALVTFGVWNRPAPDILTIRGMGEAIRVEIDTGSRPFEIVSDIINEHVKAPSLPQRLAVRLKEPVEKAAITLTFAPADLRSLGGAFPNGGFEQGSVAWQISDGGMTSISSQHHATGKYSLRITDNDSKNGSSARSLPIPVTAPGRYVLKGKYLNLSGRGLALYIRPLDHEGNVLGADTFNYRRAIGSLGDGVASTSWQAFEFPFHVPTASDAVFLWVHSISTARVDGCLDDLEIVRVEADPAKSQTTRSR